MSTIKVDKITGRTGSAGASSPLQFNGDAVTLTSSTLTSPTITSPTITTPTIDSIKLTPGSAPGSPAEGEMYYNSDNDSLNIFGTAEWKTIIYTQGKGLTSGNPATGAQEVADSGGLSGAYYVNNFTTGNTTQLVYCWIGTNGDNWQKWAPWNTHIGSAHGHTTNGCTGAMTDNFSATTANQGADFLKYSGVSGCGGNSTNTTGFWGDKLVSTMDGIKLMCTFYRQNVSANHQVSLYIQADTSAPTNYNDGGTGKIHFFPKPDQNDNGIAILSMSYSGTTMTWDSKYWINASAPSDYALNDLSVPDGTFSTSFTPGTTTLWSNYYGWADYSPDSYQGNTHWINT